MPPHDYRSIAAIAQARRAASIPTQYLLPSSQLEQLPQNLTFLTKTSGHFSHAEIEIIHSEAEVILQKIRERIWTSLEVTEAFCKAATVAQQLVGSSLLVDRRACCVGYGTWPVG